jgi:alpha-ketoglutarate-dependent taurine dioxygenase
VDLQPGKPPILRVEATGDAARWTSEHRNALRAFVAEHGSLLVRGLGLRDAAETEAVFRQLGSLMTEREAFAPRRRYSEGVYSASKWPPNQHICMHHELSYALEPPGLMLRTWQRRSAVVRHPRTGQRCWFNQIAFLNEWTMDPEVREYLVDTYGEDGLPFNTRFGNGDPIGADVIQLIDEVYEKNTARERWQSGDLFLVDNVRTAHGRESFEGPREVLVAIADPVHLADCSPTIEVTAS